MNTENEIDRVATAIAGTYAVLLVVAVTFLAWLLW